MVTKHTTGTQMGKYRKGSALAYDTLRDAGCTLWEKYDSPVLMNPYEKYLNEWVDSGQL